MKNRRLGFAGAEEHSTEASSEQFETWARFVACLSHPALPLNRALGSARANPAPAGF